MDIPSLPLSQIGHRSPAVLAHHKIKAALLAIGSNYQADYYLAKVAEQLTALGEMQVSTPLQNPDFTATVEQPKPDYVNQCLLLSLHAPMNLSALQKVLKGFEAKCDRHRDNESNSSCKLEGGGNQALSEKGGGYHSSRVTMDIDILMVQLGQDLATDSTDFSLNSLSNLIIEVHADSQFDFEVSQTTFKRTTLDRSIAKKNEWLIMTNRYPFKAHEILGLKELLLRR